MTRPIDRGDAFEARNAEDRWLGEFASLVEARDAIRENVQKDDR